MQYIYDIIFRLVIKPILSSFQDIERHKYASDNARYNCKKNVSLLVYSYATRKKYES